MHSVPIFAKPCNFRYYGNVRKSVKNQNPLFEKSYLETLKERKKTSRVYTPYQMLGLELAETLEDEKHKSLYIKLAKTMDKRALIECAKDIAARKNIKNKGAYFMRMMQKLKI